MDLDSNLIKKEGAQWQKRKKRKVKKTQLRKRRKRKPRPKKKPKSEGEIRNIRPQIDAATFGSIFIEGREFGNDVILRLDGSIQKRKKKLSKRVYGTSHTISREEIRFVYVKGAALLIIGTGHYNRVELSEEARRYLNKHGCRVKLEATPKAIHTWNAAGEKTIALFHVTC